MDPSSDDTITAIATPPGRAGIGIIRISGPKAFAVAKKLFRPKNAETALQSHRLCFGHLVDPDSGVSRVHLFKPAVGAEGTPTEITVTAQDASGNSSQATVEFMLQHDNRKY